MTPTLSASRDALEDARRKAFRPIVVLGSTFAAVSAAMIVFLSGVSAAGSGVDSAVWVRCSLVLGSAIIVLSFAVTAARGSRRAWVRLRIVGPVIVAAVVVIVSIPGFLPDWVRLEQAACGILLLPVAILVNLPRTGALFPRTGVGSAP